MRNASLHLANRAWYRQLQREVEVTNRAEQVVGVAKHLPLSCVKMCNVANCSTAGSCNEEGGREEDHCGIVKHHYVDKEFTTRLVEAGSRS